MFVIAYAGKIQPLSTRNLWFWLRYYMSLAIEKSSISSHIITVYTNVLRNGSFSNSTPACLKEVVKTSKEASNSFQMSLKTSFKCVAVGSILKASISLHMRQFFHPIIEFFKITLAFTAMFIAVSKKRWNLYIHMIGINCNICHKRRTFHDCDALSPI